MLKIKSGFPTEISRYYAITAWGVLLHELGERFNSPTVNLFFGAEDYIKFLE